MKWSKQTVVLLALNLGLLAGVGYLIVQLRKPLPSVPGSPVVEFAPSHLSAPKAPPPNPASTHG